jgi:hypothetical protein
MGCWRLGDVKVDRTMASPSILTDPYDFSVVLGGPLYQIYRRAHLCGDTLELVVRRVVVITAVAWIPLLILSVGSGRFVGGARQPFLFDVDVHARLLVALPLLIASEWVVHQRLRVTLRQFLERGLIPDRARAGFDATLAAAFRLRNSVLPEVILIAAVYAVGVLVIWRNVSALPIDTWYRQTGDGGQVTPAGWWYVFVSLPLFQFLLFRWYYRLIIWAWVLWKISRSELDLVPTHPDRCAGLGFLNWSSYALVPLLFAHGTLFAGVAAGGILFEGRELVSYWPQFAAVTALALLVALAPLLVFADVLFRAKRDGLRDYGALAQRYVRDFDRKWLHDEPDERLLGSGDIQSLADLANSFGVVSEIRFFITTRTTLVLLVLATLLPVMPLVFTTFSPREVAAMLWNGLF